MVVVVVVVVVMVVVVHAEIKYSLAKQRHKGDRMLLLVGIRRVKGLGGPVTKASYSGPSILCDLLRGEKTIQADHVCVCQPLST